MKIGIDAGHGLNTAGKRCAKQFDTNETREWFLNNRVATKVCEILNRSGIETLRLDDTTGNVDIDLNVRCKNANNANVDMVISIHHNAGGGTGIETYVYNDACKRGETGRLATIIHNKVIETTGMKNRGIRTGNFAIIRDTKMKACLIECGFMDNANDTPIILTEEYANKVANGIADGILAYGGVERKDVQVSIQKQTTQVQTNPTKTIANCSMLNLRTSASYGDKTRNDNIYKAVKAGTQVEYIGNENGWAKIQYEGRTLYCGKNYLI